MTVKVQAKLYQISQNLEELDTQEKGGNQRVGGIETGENDMLSPQTIQDEIIHGAKNYGIPLVPPFPRILNNFENTYDETPHLRPNETVE